MGRPRKSEATTTTISWGADGYWHGYVTVGRKANGAPDIRHRTARGCASCQGKPREGCECYERCAAKIRDLEAKRKANSVPKAGQRLRLREWFDWWMTNVVSDLRYGTQERGYGWCVKRMTRPDGIGEWWLDELDEHVIEGFFRRMAESGNTRTGTGLAKDSVESLWRCLRASLNDAVRRRMGITRNPCDFVRLPRFDEIGESEEITPLFVEEVVRILDVASTMRNGSRWTVGLPLGLRQGEAIGMPWYVPAKSTRDNPHGMDRAGAFAIVGQKAERHLWRHGCDDPTECAKPHCRTRECNPGWYHGCADESACKASRGCWCPNRKPGKCRIHRGDQCPPPCPPNCTDHAKRCPKRKGGCRVSGCNCSGIVFGPPKSKAGRRRAVLGEHMAKAVVAHREAQDKEREAAAEAWREHGLVWCNPDGTPIAPETDRREWKRILSVAGVRDARLHDGRHTAATMLLLQGVDGRVVMDLFGWTDRKLLDRYQHVIDEMRADAANRLESLLYGPPPADPGRDAELAQARLDKALADVERLKAESEVAQLRAELEALRTEAGSYSTAATTVARGATVLPFRRPA